MAQDGPSGPSGAARVRVDVVPSGAVPAPDLEKRLRVGKLLGSGAFAVVHAAVYDGKQVALKVLLPHHRPSTRDDCPVRMFLREGELLQRLEHSNLVRCLAILELPPTFPGLNGGYLTSTWGLVLELLEGGSMCSLMHKQLLSPWKFMYDNATALAWSTHVASALAYLHAESVIHRDVKMENVLIAGGKAKLVDLGLHTRPLTMERCTRQTLLRAPMSRHSTRSLSGVSPAGHDAPQLPGMLAPSPAASSYPTSQYPASQYPASQYASSLYPASQYGASNYASAVGVRPPSAVRIDEVPAAEASESSIFFAVKTASVQGDGAGSAVQGDAAAQAGTAAVPVIQPVDVRSRSLNRPLRPVPGARPIALPVTAGLAAALSPPPSVVPPPADMFPLPEAGEEDAVRAPGSIDPGAPATALPASGEADAAVVATAAAPATLPPSSSRPPTTLGACPSMARSASSCGTASAAPGTCSGATTTNGSSRAGWSVGNMIEVGSGHGGSNNTGDTALATASAASSAGARLPPSRPPSTLSPSAVQAVHAAPSRSAANAGADAEAGPTGGSDDEEEEGGLAPLGMSRAASPAPLGIQHTQPHPAPAQQHHPHPHGQHRFYAQQPHHPSASAVGSATQRHAPGADVSNHTAPAAVGSTPTPEPAAAAIAAALGSSRFTAGPDGPVRARAATDDGRQLYGGFGAKSLHAPSMHAYSVAVSVDSGMEVVYRLTGETGSCMTMAPEIRLAQPYNEKIDVYAYGVLLYELWSRSMLAVSHIGTKRPDMPRVVHKCEDWPNLILEGYRPKRVDCIPRPIWQLIVECWDADPLCRPPMSAVLARLQEMAEDPLLADQVVGPNSGKGGKKLPGRSSSAGVAAAAGKGALAGEGEAKQGLAPGQPGCGCVIC
ncbi:hypothetical protein HYH03_007065 [Edaphochlamys debaryana]|uniref:Protein kinase domain-containing protein n=1 Tax=Edaphochlamys debaryana TaxID=47281 RepID=A0A835Y2Q1_9CHLO|nr:hypothetical protein HYH03_007065 [Edaphochlamys debaryana]|eukprot:KAG2494823.1 hypothetical protein HYH03_007065 [Edaphochlamys debaryana]